MLPEEEHGGDASMVTCAIPSLVSWKMGGALFSIKGVMTMLGRIIIMDES